jgi:hypothetical protein
MATPLSAFQGISVNGLTANSLSGFTLATPFNYSLVVPASAGITQAAITYDYNLIWWFGDGTYSTEYSPTHVYNWPGVYEVKLGIFNNNTGVQPLTFSVLVTASNYITDNLQWDYSKWSDLNAGQPTNGACFHGYQSCYSGTSAGPIPLTINYQTSILDSSTLNFSFYADNSLSQPATQVLPNQLSDLRPQWRFTTASAMPLLESEAIISTYQPTNSTPILIDANGNISSTGTLVGLSGSFNFFYIDDIPSMVTSYTSALVLSAQPTTIWVTLDLTNAANLPSFDYTKVPSYSNSLVSLSSYYYVQSFNPDHIDITINGTVPFNSVYWPGVESRFVTTVNSPLSSGNASYLSDVILLNYPLHISTGNTGNTFVTTLSTYTGVVSADFNLSTSPVTGNYLYYSLNRTDSLGRDTGGYYLGTFTPYVTGTTVLVATYNRTDGVTGIGYVNDLIPDPVTGYNPLYISVPASPTVSYIPVHGTSVAFKVIDFNSTFFARKINGGFDFGAQLFSYALQPTIAQNTNLFENYLAAVAGTSATNEDTYGGVVYEKASNFVRNVADPSSANVNAFYSIAQSLGVTLDNYNYGYNIPPALGRVVDLYSTQQSVVWGARSQFARNFALPTGHTNLGSSLTAYDIATTIVTAGQLVVANDLFNTQYYELLEVPPINSYSSLTARGLSALLPLNAYPLSSYPLNVYPLSAFIGWGLITPVQYNYRFFVYNNTIDNQQVEGLINWDDSLTTLPELSGSNHAQWVADEGTLETIFNYYIHKGLGLIK